MYRPTPAIIATCHQDQYLAVARCLGMKGTIFMASEALNESRLTTGLSRDTLSDQVAKHLLHYIINRISNRASFYPLWGF